MYTFGTLIFLIIAGGIYSLCKRFTIIDKDEIKTYNKTIGLVEERTKKLIDLNKELTTEIEAANFKLQEIGTENENLKSDVQYHQLIGEKAGQMVENHFKNITSPLATARLKTYSREKIIENFRISVNRCVEGLATTDFTQV